MDVLEDLAAPAQAGQLSLLDAYSSVHYGDLTSRDFVKAVYAGMPPGLSGARVSAPELPVDGLVIWDGPIPPPKGRPPKPGHFWVANPYKSAAVQKIAPGYSRQHGYGLQASDIAAITAIFAEVDEAPEGGPLAIEAQLRFYDDLEAETGLRWSAVVLSGDARPSAHAALYGRGQLVPGKSVHAYLSTWAEVSEPGALALRQRAVDALCALTGGDAAVRDVSRKMRLGGTLARVETQEVGGGRARVQTCLRAERVSYPLQVIVDRLEAACASRGIVVSSMLDALQACAQARTRARAWDKAAEQGTVTAEEAKEARDALLELALEIRLSGAVSPEQRLRLGQRGAPKGPLAVGEQGTTRQIEVGHSSGSWDADTTILTHASGQSGTAEALWNSLLRGWRVPDVHCISHADTHASAFLTRWGSDANPGWTVHCPTCGKITSKRPFADLESRLDSSLDGIEDLSPASAAAPAAPVPPQDGAATAQVMAPPAQKAATPQVPDMRTLFSTFLEELEAPIKAHQAAFPAMGERDFDVDDLEPVGIAEESGDLSVPVYKESSIYRLEPTKTVQPTAPAPQAPAPQVPQTYTAQVLADAAAGEHARWMASEAIEDAERRQADSLAEWIEAERAIFKAIVDLDEARGGCKRGPTTHYAHERSAVISSSRATCVSWGCPSCGLRKKAAVRAALRVYSSTRLETWTGATLGFSPVSQEKRALALSAALRRWKDDSPATRSWIGLETSPGTIELLVAWASPDDAPRLKLARTLAQGTQCAPGEAGERLDEIADRLDLEATGAHDSRHCVLRGGREDRTAVSDLLECVVGRGRALKKKGLQRGPKGKIEAAASSTAPASIVVATYDKLSSTIKLGGGVHRAQGLQDGEITIHEANLSALDEGKLSIRWAPGHTRPPSDQDHLRSPEQLAELPPTPYEWLRDQTVLEGIKKIHRKTRVDPVLLEAGDATISMGARGARVVRSKKTT